MPFDVIILGPPGAGKGTQAKRICEEMPLVHIATGDMLREARAAGTELGDRVTGYMDAGELVPDEVMIDLIEARLAEPDTEPGVLFDGFPRTLVQAEALDAMLARIQRGAIGLVLQLQVDDEAVIARLVGRADDEKRTDDAPDVVKNRLAVYRRQTEPLVAYYRIRGILVGIPGNGTVDEVFVQIQETLRQANDDYS